MIIYLNSPKKGKKIYINESTFNLLLEDKREKQKDNQCVALAGEYFGPGSIESYKVYKDFKDDFYHGRDIRNTYMMVLAPFFFRLCLEIGFGSIKQSNQKKNNIKKVFKYLEDAEKRGVVNLKTLDLSMDYDTLMATFGKEAIKAEKVNRANLKIKKNPNYKILGPLTFEEANKIGNHSYSNLPLCYTQEEDTWMTYTDRGENTVYCALRNDWKNVPEVHDNGTTSDMANAYDNYGLSMIFVIVDPNGNLVYSNSRWNHQGKYITSDVDQAFTKDSLTKILGIPFDEAFKPVETEFVNKKLLKIYSEIKRNPGSFVDYFYDETYLDENERVAVVEYKEKYNIFFVDTGELAFPDIWFDSYREEYEKDGKFELAVYAKGNRGYVMIDMINHNGYAISTKEHYENTAALLEKKVNSVHDSQKYVIISNGAKNTIYDNVKKEYVNPYIWFSYVDKVDHDSIQVLENNGIIPYIISDYIESSDRKFNFLGMDGKLVFPFKWMSRVDGIVGNYLLCEYEDNNESQSETKLIDLTTRKEVPIESLNGLVEKLYAEGKIEVKGQRIKIGTRWSPKVNIINKEDGKILFNDWFDRIKICRTDDDEKFYMVNKKHSWKVYDTNGVPVYDEWFDSVNYEDSDDIPFDMVVVRNFDYKYNFLNLKTRQILTPNLWYDGAGEFDEYGRAVVQIRKNFTMYTIIDTNGIVKTRELYDYIKPLGEGYYMVKSNKHKKPYNIIDANGNYSFKNFVYDITQYGDLVYVTKNYRDKAIPFTVGGKNLEDIYLTELYQNSWKKCLKGLNNNFSRTYVLSQIPNTNGLFVVDYIHGFYNIGFGKNSDLVSPDRWFSETPKQHYKILIVKDRNNLYNFVTFDGKIVSPNMWFKTLSKYKYISDIKAYGTDGKLYNINAETGEISRNEYDAVTNKINKALANGVDFNNIFNSSAYYEEEGIGGYYIVDLAGKLNYLINNRIISNTWFDKAEDFFENSTRLYAEVNKKGLRNLIRPDGSLVSKDKWANSMYSTGNRLFHFAYGTSNNKIRIFDFSRDRFLKGGMLFKQILGVHQKFDNDEKIIQVKLDSGDIAYLSMETEKLVTREAFNNKQNEILLLGSQKDKNFSYDYISNREVMSQLDDMYELKEDKKTGKKIYINESVLNRIKKLLNKKETT